MKISIVGAGAVGIALCEALSEKVHDVTLIEKNEHKLEQLISNYDIMGILGNGANINVLKEAQVAQCDIFISVTNHDEANLMASIVAKELGAKYTIARVSNPEYIDYLNFSKGMLGIDLIVNPELVATAEILHSLDYPSALGVQSYFDNRVHMISLLIHPESLADGLVLSELHTRMSLEKDLLICAVRRGDQTFIPTGDFVLAGGDLVYVTGKPNSIHEFYRLLGGETKPIKSVLIIGASRIAFHLVPKLLSRHIEVKIIEHNEQRAKQIAGENSQATVILGDGTSTELLFEEYMGNFDACIALTGVDEENMVINILAQRLGVRKSITKVDRVELLKYIDLIDLQTVITPHQIFAYRVIQLVRSFINVHDSAIESYDRLTDSSVEVMTFLVKNEEGLVGVPLSDLDLIDHVLITSIVRGDQLIVPSGNDQIEAGDRIMIVVSHQSIDELHDILRRG